MKPRVGWVGGRDAVPLYKNNYGKCARRALQTIVVHREQRKLSDAVRHDRSAKVLRREGNANM
jgi:hypothetical protein